MRTLVAAIALAILSPLAAQLLQTQNTETSSSAAQRNIPEVTELTLIDGISSKPIATLLADSTTEIPLAQLPV